MQEKRSHCSSLVKQMSNLKLKEDLTYNDKEGRWPGLGNKADIQEQTPCSILHCI